MDVAVFALLTAALAAVFLFAHEIVIYTAGPDFAASAPILAVLSIAVAIRMAPTWGGASYVQSVSCMASGHQ